MDAWYLEKLLWEEGNVKNCHHLSNEVRGGETYDTGLPLFVINLTED